MKKKEEFSLMQYQKHKQMAKKSYKRNNLKKLHELIISIF